MSTENVRFNCIKAISVVGGFLDGIDIRFSDGLNCVIGPRGTGKTTVLEFIRYALNSFPDGGRGVNAWKRVENLIKSNLGDGRIRVTIESKDGIEYIVDRTAIGAPIVLTSDGEPTEISLKGDSFFTADIFSQNEVEDIADNLASQLTLLDSFAREEIRSLEESIRRIQDDLRTNANQIVPAQRKQSELQEDLTTLPQIESKIQSLSNVGGENATEINLAHAHKSLRDREQQALSAAQNYLQSYTGELKTLADKFIKTMESSFPEDVLNGPNRDILTQVLTDLKICDNDLRGHFEQIAALIEKQQGSIKIKEQELKTLQDRQEIVFRDLIERHKEAQGQSIERTKWEQKRNELLTKKQALDDASKQLDQLFEERRNLLARLSDCVDTRFNARQKVAEFIKNNVDFPLRVRLTQFGNKTGYENFLAESLKGAGINHRVVASKVVAGISPEELGDIVRQNKVDSLVQLADINQSQAEKVIKTLNTSESLLTLEAVELVDLPSIELRDGEEYKNSLSLSTGQKCTSILPILLLESENPLLIDQPEDNLDNRFIFETVVDGIKRVKKHRQMIFITHNPNIPVLGEAASVFVLASNGVQSRIHKSGTVDDCKNEIIDLLEGGKEAFQRRRDRYQY